MRVETEYEKKLKIKKKQQSAFRRFIRGRSTPVAIREWIGLNYLEIKVLLEARMLDTMNWKNYGSYWVIDHVVPFWLFDLNDEADLKLLWHPDNLLPLVWKDNNHKQGDLRFSLLLLTRRSGYSFAAERLIERVEKEIKVQDKYLYPQKAPM
jgi:hypothetical protein